MRDRVSNVIWGLLFIVLGVGFMGRAFWGWQFTIFFSGWWTLFIIIPCAVGLIRNGFRTGYGIGLMVGIVLFMSQRKWLPMHIVGKLFFPAILVIIGLSILFRGSLNGSRHVHVDRAGNPNDYVAVFSAQKVRYPMEKFIGGSVNAIFGGVDIDLRDAIIDEDIVLDATAVFGGIDIMVPSNVRVKVSNIPVFGMASNKTIEPIDMNAPTIFVNSTCMFGGIDIK